MKNTNYLMYLSIKGIIRLLLVIIILFSIIPRCNADIRNYLNFTGGLITAYALHEFGHFAALKLTNTDLDWSIGTYNQPIAFIENVSSNQDGRIVHSAGLLTQIALSEIILQSNIDKNSNFTRGMMSWNIINPIIYFLDYKFIKRTNQENEDSYQGDIKGFEHFSNERNTNILFGGITAIAISQGYRYMQTQDWCPDWMYRNDLRLNFLHRNNDEFGLMIEIDF